MHEVLVNRLGGLSLPRKPVVRLTDRPDMTLDVYRGRKTTMQQQQHFVAEPRFRLLGISFAFFLLHFLCVCRLFFSFAFGVKDKIESIIGLRCRPSNSDPRVYG